MEATFAVVPELLRNLFESSDSESSDDEPNAAMIIILNYTNRIPRVRCRNYVEDVVALYTDEEFKMHFRMQRNTFQRLLELLTPDLRKQSNRYGRNPISPQKQLLIAIWMMATPNSYRCVSDRFDTGKATAWRSVRKVVNALYKRAASFIKWPTAEEAEGHMHTVQYSYGFRGVIGAVDGTHIKITAQKENSASYVNRKGFHSIQLQVICDPQLHFIHCYAGQVGSVHDMRVLRLSQFDNMCTDENFPRDGHILGDAAYQISKYIMVRFKDNGHLSDRQRNFNDRLSSARMMVKRSLGLLKGGFRSLLDTLPMQRTYLIPKYIIACCVLHNICLSHNDILEIPLIVDRAQSAIVQDARVQPNTIHREGIEKRNAIMYSL